MAEDFYWRHARDSLITPPAIKMFQLLATHEGEDFDSVKHNIDNDYRKATGSEGVAKHGGLIQTWVQSFREAGWVEFEASAQGAQIIRLTPAGKQALQLLAKVPDFLKAVPHFIVELLSRFQLNNPARPKTSKNPEYDAKLKDSDIFPYWTLFKIMRECDRRISSEELRRFVFRLKNTSEVSKAIQQIKEFRKDKATGLSSDELDKKYPIELEGAISEPKYIMGRLGTQVGQNPAIVEKEGPSTWVLNGAYLPFIDEILRNQPVYQEHLTEKSWLVHYGKPVMINKEEDLARGEEQEYDITLADSLGDDDPVWVIVKQLVDSGSVGVILSGPPGTSKTWYARRLAAKLAKGRSGVVRFIQFHPSYSYDDFVEGYIPDSSENQSSFVVRPKIFLRLCERARAASSDLHVMVIDELNRGDPSKIFGELLTYLERDYRDLTFSLPYSGRQISIPGNLVILATMNPYDKSVVDLDDAFERRFDRVALDPSVDSLRSILTNSGMSGELIGRVIGFFT